MKKGDCAQIAGNAVLDGKGQFILCHAFVKGQGELKRRRIFHAWVEHQDMVFDNSNGHKVIMRKEQYYQIAKIKKGDIKKYTIDELMPILLKSKHWGPWGNSFNKKTKR